MTSQEMQNVITRANNAEIVARNVFNRQPCKNAEDLADAVVYLAQNIKQ